MKFFIDTADTDAIRDLTDLGMVDGVTTNPSLVMKSGRDFKEVLKDICGMVPGPVSAEVRRDRRAQRAWSRRAGNWRRSPRTSRSRCR